MWKSYIAFILYLSCCVIVGLLIAMLSPNQCISKYCAQKTRLILQDMNSKVAPCTDFYEFACGRYRKKAKEKGVYHEKSIWEEMIEAQMRRLVQFLMRPETKNEDRVLRLLKMSYKSCLDTKEIEREGLEPLLYNIHHVGGFPLLEGESWERKSRTSNWTLGAVMFNIHSKGFSGGKILNIYVEHSEGGKHSHSVHLSSPQYLEFADSHFDHHYSYVKKILALMRGGRPSSEDNDKELNETLRFKAELVRSNIADQNCSTPFQNEDLNSFLEEFPFLKLQDFLKPMIFGEVLPEEISLSDRGRKYLTKIKALVEKTSNRALMNYFIIENVIEMTPLLPTKFREAYVELVDEVGNPRYRVKKDRKLICLECINGKLSSALSSLYLREVVRKYYRPNILMPMIVSLKAQLKATVGRLGWMDSRTKREAMKKVDSMNFEVPLHRETFDALTNRTAFRVYYEDLCFTGNSSNTLTNVLSLQRFVTDKNWELLDRDVEVFDLGVDVFSSDIEFDQKTNTVLIPLAFLKLPVFFSGWPSYLNFGGLGSKIATEMVRSIDASGAALDSEGRSAPWWSVETKAAFGKHERCFINQYNDYLEAFTKVKLRDPKCSEDAVAHSTGVKVAFLAYLHYERSRFMPEGRLPLLNQYSPRQMFFFDYATFYCDNRKDPYRGEATEEAASRPSSEFKVLAGLRNLQPFQESFHCSANDSMSLSAKCDLSGE